MTHVLTILVFYTMLVFIVATLTHLVRENWPAIKAALRGERRR